MLKSNFKEAKVLRFKEVGLWRYDENGYFTNASNKYIMYDNLDFGHRMTPGKEISSLITAMILGKLLSRIVILPKFHCYGCVDMDVCRRVKNDCSFNALFHVKSLDLHFSGQYREHSFLKQPKVPGTIKGSITPKIHIFTKGSEDYEGSALGDIIRIEAKNKNRIFPRDVISWFGQGWLSEFAVLRFHSLDFNIHFEDHSRLSILNDALKPCNYRQDPRDPRIM